ncbi:hypothetical protein IMX26_01965 [Clostridium sp. 'deep sea']|nr:hypothetical protein IMX26_01965 [Clostridium sp. 'deep sea']
MLLLCYVLTKGESTSNNYFFSNDVEQVNYQGKFLFASYNEQDIILFVNEVVKHKEGILYQLKLNTDEVLNEERLIIGYFYITKDCIYKINPTEENLNQVNKKAEIPADSVIVCQETAVKDSVAETEKGFHSYITVNDNKCVYHSYNNGTETGYYETFVWEKNKGLVHYKSGYGAELNSIELNIIE